MQANLLLILSFPVFQLKKSRNQDVKEVFGNYITLGRAAIRLGPRQSHFRSMSLIVCVSFYTGPTVPFIVLSVK